MGVKVDSLEMEDCSMGDFHIQMSVRDRLSNFRWVVVSVYGPAQHNKSRDFIDELSNLCLSCPLPMVRGDFDLIRTVDEKNSNLGDQSLMDLFHAFIGNF